MSVNEGAALGDEAFASQLELTKTLEEELIHLQQKAAGADHKIVSQLQIKSPTP